MQSGSAAPPPAKLSERVTKIEARLDEILDKVAEIWEAIGSAGAQPMDLDQSIEGAGSTIANKK
jgi:hypothetical protein